jgi:hypothetical protein
MFIEVPVPKQESKLSRVCVLDVSIFIEVPVLK